MENKMSKNNNKQLILDLVDAVTALGWEILIPNAEDLGDDDPVHGMIIGSTEFLDEMTNDVKDELEIIDKPDKEFMH